MNTADLATPEMWERFFKMRAFLFEQIRKALEEDGHCKSYEGHLTVGFTFRNYFAAETSAEPCDGVVVKLHCYVFGPARHYEWQGKTLDDALNKVAEDFKKWARDDAEERAA